MVLEVLVRHCGGVWLGGDFANKERVGGRLTAPQREVQFVQKEYDDDAHASLLPRSLPRPASCGQKPLRP